MKKVKKGNWIVQMKCTIIKDVYVQDCTEQEAYSNPFQYSVSEQDTSLEDWEVLEVEADD